MLGILKRASFCQFDMYYLCKDDDSIADSALCILTDIPGGPDPPFVVYIRLCL